MMGCSSPLNGFFTIVAYFSISLCFHQSTSVVAQVNPPASVGTLSTHVLDISLGFPAANVSVALSLMDVNGSTWQSVVQKNTDSDGRIGDFFAGNVTLFSNGIYKMVYQTKNYFLNKNLTTFFPFIEVIFEVTNSNQDYHVPLLVSAYGFSTYRGS